MTEIEKKLEQKLGFRLEQLSGDENWFTVRNGSDYCAATKFEIKLWLYALSAAQRVEELEFALRDRLCAKQP